MAKIDTNSLAPSDNSDADSIDGMDVESLVKLALTDKLERG